MDLLSCLFIFSPMKVNKTFTNVVTQNISEIAALRLVMSWQKKFAADNVALTGTAYKFSQSFRGLADVGQFETLLGNRYHCVF